MCELSCQQTCNLMASKIYYYVNSNGQSTNYFLCQSFNLKANIKAAARCLIRFRFHTVVILSDACGYRIQDLLKGRFRRYDFLLRLSHAISRARAACVMQKSYTTLATQSYDIFRVVCVCRKDVVR